VQEAQQALARSEQRERDVLAQRDTLQARLDEVLVTCQDREAALSQLEAARAAAQAELEEARVGRLRLEAAMQEAQQAIARSGQLERDVLAQRDAHQARLDEVLVTCQEREAALSQLETAYGNLAVAHAAATAERDRLVSALREHAVHLEALANGVPWAGGDPDAAEGFVAPGVGREDGRA